MNLRGIANILTQAVNPNVTASLQVCTGYRRTPEYEREPIYAEPVDCTIQAQVLTKKEIEHLDSLNLSNAVQAIYADRQLTCVDRVTQSGGDLITYTDPASGVRNVWYAVAILEDWNTSGWCKAAIAKQTDRPTT